MRRRHTGKQMEPGEDTQQPLLTTSEQQVQLTSVGGEQTRLFHKCFLHLRYWLGRLAALLLKISKPLKGGEQAAPLIQAEQVQALRRAAAEKYEEANDEHRQALKQLWEHAFPTAPFPPAVKSPLWKEMGWQGEDPGTDFRGSGMLGLQNLLYLASTHPRVFEALLHKTNGTRAAWEYPFACAGTNLTFILADMLELKPGNRVSSPAASQWPSGSPAKGFARLMRTMDAPDAFAEIYTASFRLLDHEWLRTKASYMEFNQVLTSVKRQVSSALSALPASMAQFHEFLQLSSGLPMP